MKNPITILFLASNPIDTSPIRLGEEVRSIQEKLRLSRYRDGFRIEQEWAVRVSDLQGHLLRHSPCIVHFSGHGSSSSEIILEDASGNSQPVSKNALSQLFSVLKENIRCVVLNACYTEEQANILAEHVDCVIGMSKAIGDKAAIAFSTAFYQAIGYGRNLFTAYQLGCNAIHLENSDEYNTPKLIAIHGDPKQIVLAQNTLDDEANRIMGVLKSIFNYDRKHDMFYFKGGDEGSGEEVFEKEFGALTISFPGSSVAALVTKAVREEKAGIDVEMDVEDRLGSPGSPEYLWWENNTKQYTTQARIALDLSGNALKISLELPDHGLHPWHGW